jgi:hypothetical protein
MKSFNIMAWMQTAYVNQLDLPWPKKVMLKIKLFIQRNFVKIKGTPGSELIDTLLAQSKPKAMIPQKPKMSRADLSKMWDSLEV